MNRMKRSGFVAVAALWGIIATASFSGWLIGHGVAEAQLDALKQRLAESAPPKSTCAMNTGEADTRSANPFGVTLKGILAGAPQEPHLREMLTLR